MSKFDVSDYSADELNQGIDDTNFPYSRHTSSTSTATPPSPAIAVDIAKSSDENEAPRRPKIASMPLPVKQNGVLSKSFSDEVFEPGTPKTPRSIPTPGNCEWIQFDFI